MEEFSTQLLECFNKNSIIFSFLFYFLFNLLFHVKKTPKPSHFNKYHNNALLKYRGQNVACEPNRNPRLHLLTIVFYLIKNTTTTRSLYLFIRVYDKTANEECDQTS